MSYQTRIDTTASQPGPPISHFDWFDVSETLSFIALAVGVAILVIAYFAGGKENSSKLFFSIIVSTLVGVLVMPLFIKFGLWLGVLDTTGGVITLIILAMLFVSAVAANSYEIVTVTAREARPPQ